MSDQDTPIIYLKDYTPTPYAVSHVDLKFEIFDGYTLVHTTLNIAPRNENAGYLELDGQDIQLQKLAIDGVQLSDTAYEVSNDILRIKTVPNVPFVLSSTVRIAPESNTYLEGLYRSNGIWCTQCEAEGFRRITFMYDRPDVMATYSVRLEADISAAPILLSNGNPTASGQLDAGRHYSEWQDPHPKPTYLFALVAGDLAHISDEFVTASGANIALKIYCELGKEKRCDYAMEALKHSMRWDEERFGREYDLDVFNIVAVSDFNSGAMENKGLNIFNDKLILADPLTATDADYAGIERVVSHEYFHNWTGNRITCRDWFQLCLKEGLTVYRDQEFTSDMRSRNVKRIQDVRKLWVNQFPEDAGPLAHAPRPDHYKEINNFYTMTVYEKGAEVVRMLATLLGETGFKKGMDLYFNRHDGDATTIEAWLKVFEDATGEDLSQFSIWYTQAGTPDVDVSSSWDGTTGTFSVTTKQSVAPTPGQDQKHALQVPLKFGLVGGNGNDASYDSVSGGEVRADIFVLDKSEQTFTFSGLASKPVLSINRNYSSPIKLTQNQSDEDLSFLARHDSDAVNRWMASQKIAKQMIVARVRGASYAPADAERLASALRETLVQKDSDPIFKAYCLQLPSESEIYQTLAVDIDPDAVRACRKELVALVLENIKEDLADVYRGLSVDGAYSSDIEQVQKRTLRNQALRLLMSSGDETFANEAADQFEKADNLTDKISALAASVGSNTKYAKDMMAKFDASSYSEPLVWDKWLSLTASSPTDTALEGVKKVLADPRFPKGNPNRFRSLIGGFAAGNVPQFMRLDGQGFAFVAETLGDMDAQNPQLAARMLTTFRTFRMFEPRRRDLAESNLRKLSKRENLSVNMREILGRILEG